MVELDMSWISKILPSLVKSGDCATINYVPPSIVSYLLKSLHPVMIAWIGQTYSTLSSIKSQHLSIDYYYTCFSYQFIEILYNNIMLLQLLCVQHCTQRIINVTNYRCNSVHVCLVFVVKIYVLCFLVRLEPRDCIAPVTFSS